MVRTMTSEIIYNFRQAFGVHLQLLSCWSPWVSTETKLCSTVASTESTVVATERANRHSGRLPGQGSGVVDERAVRAVGAEGGHPHGDLRALLGGAKTAVVVEVGRAVAGADRVHLDGRVLQLLRILHGRHIQRRFRRRVGHAVEHVQRI